MHDRVLVLGCSHAEIPLIEQLKKMGYHVTTMGSHIDGLGHSVADQAIHADYSSVQNVHRAIEEFQFAHVVPGANDFGYFTGAQLAPVFGLTGYDPYYCAQSLLLKSNFRDTQSILGLKRPEFIEFDAGALPQLPDEFFPVIVKPLDLSGGKGISVVGSINEFSTACAQAIGLGRTGKAIAEKYLQDLIMLVQLSSIKAVSFFRFSIRSIITKINFLLRQLHLCVRCQIKWQSVLST